MCLSLYKVWLLAELQVHPEVGERVAIPDGSLVAEHTFT